DHVASAARAPFLPLDRGAPGAGAPPFLLPFGHHAPHLFRRGVDMAVYAQFPIVGHRLGSLHDVSRGRARRAGTRRGRGGHRAPPWPPYPRRAASMAAMSILRMVIIASIAR